MRHNLLKLTQLILSAMDSDEINSIGDTTESNQVVDVIETSYNYLASTIDFPDHWDFFELLPSTDPTKPTMLRLPDDVGKLEYIQYNSSSDPNKIEYRPVHSMHRKAFFDRMNSLDISQPTLDRYDYTTAGNTFEVVVYNNKAPTYYTTPDDRTILFDSFDLAQGQTIIGNRTRCYGMRIPAFIREDTFVPDLQPRQFALLLNEAKSQAFIDIKQMENAKAEQRARRGLVQAHRISAQTPPGEIVRDYTHKSDFGRRR